MLFTQRPRRVSVLAGQFAALAVALAVAVAVMFGFGAITSTGIAVGEGASVSSPSVLDLLLGFAAGWLILLTWSCLGAVLGVVLRGVALPIGLGVVWVLGIENLVSAMAGSVLTALEPLRDVLPGVNAGSLVSAVIPSGVVEAPPGVTTSVDAGRALITLASYVLVCVAVAISSSRRRDVA